MGDQSRIEWTDATWNPTRGCSKVSEGCRNCYAMRQAIRQSGPGGAYDGLVRSIPGKGPQWTGFVTEIRSALRIPTRWKKPRRIFVDSMSDLFHDGVTDRFISEVWGVMSVTPRHTYQILTKRPERASALIPELAREHRPPDGSRWPLPNVWIGTSVEDQAAADERIPHLLRTPAAVRFLSCEPLLGPVDLEWWIHGEHEGGPLHWVIVGGESGPGARGFHVGWAHSLRDQCDLAGIAFFLKQLGARPYERARLDEMLPAGACDRWELKDRKGGDPAEWPEDLRVREFPETYSGEGAP